MTYNLNCVLAKLLRIHRHLAQTGGFLSKAQQVTLQGVFGAGQVQVQAAQRYHKGTYIDLGALGSDRPIKIIRWPGLPHAAENGFTFAAFAGLKTRPL